MTEEIWKDIPGYEDLYQVSNIGRVKSFKRGKEAVRVLSLKKSGYLYVCLCNSINKHLRVNRLVALAFIPNPENKSDVNHKNGIKSDNRVENLEWNTPSENRQHAYRAGL